MGQLTVELGERSYEVQVVRRSLAGLGAAVAAATSSQRVVLVTEDTVGPLWAAAARRSLQQAGKIVELVTLPAGEANKTIATWTMLVDRLLALGVDRRTPLIALGGGVLGDIVGFAAASTLRGLPFVQVPTTLLAMVDSSVGGKTGVNHPVGKNLVGAFHQPLLVHADVATLGTLPIEETRAGLAEAVKSAMIGDPDFFEWMERRARKLRDGDADALIEVVERCVALKAAVVAADEREAGLREVLNLGHTVGHGLETVLGYGALRHGEAVGIGLVAEARWAVREGLCQAGLPERVADLLHALGLPTGVPDCDLDAVAAAMRLDKKGRATFVRVPIPVRIGEVRRVEVTHERLPELLA
ncbi:MAG: 3-dehydroquinate synthase [Deltaproteobacteria bacterium]|nr:MAG: 3-dehydroquinate synthase [Deltaproteobacteria bacterium]